MVTVSVRNGAVVAFPPHRAVIVGAGIGGLAAARALGRAGWRVTVLERAPDSGELGAGITLFDNALRALDELGMGHAVRSRGTWLRGGGLRDPSGRWLLRAPGADASAAGLSLSSLHRSDLHRTLLEAQGSEQIITGAQVCGVDSTDVSAHVTYVQEGVQRVLEATFVVGADGVRSTVRGSLYPRSPAPAYRGYAAWRGVGRLPLDRRHVELTWGNGDEFGIVPLGDERVYWFASQLCAPGGDRGNRRADVLRRFGSWHAPIGDVVRMTPDGQLLYHDVVDLPTPLPPLATGRVALLGDAAHAATPDLGQGAALALEDAVELGACLAPPGCDVTSALARYDRARRPRVQRVVRRSRMAGRVAHPRSRWALTARTALLRLVPTRLGAAAGTAAATWKPPHLPRT